MRNVFAMPHPMKNGRNELGPYMSCNELQIGFFIAPLCDHETLKLVIFVADCPPDDAVTFTVAIPPQVPSGVQFKT